jgi:DNA polymerase-4
VGDLARFDERTLRNTLGANQSAHLHGLAWARDDRPVEPSRDAKSIGHEETYPRDLTEIADLERELVRLADAVSARLRRNGSSARTATLKVRYAGFRTITRSVTVATPVDTGPELVDALRPALRALDLSEGVRLLGVSGSNLVEPVHQLNLLDDTDAPHRAAGAIDRIRQRFGSTAIGPASAVGPDGVRVVRKGAQQWGPDQRPEGKPGDTR